MRRDMSQREFEAACRRRGFSPAPFGYQEHRESGVMVPDAPQLSRRERLARLVREFESMIRKLGRN